MASRAEESGGPTPSVGKGSSRGGGRTEQVGGDRPSGGVKTDREGAERLLQMYLQVVKERIERFQYYPPIARRMGWEGEAVLQFRIGSDGRVGAIRLVRSSSSPYLDRTAREIVKSASPFPPPPPALVRNSPLIIKIPIRFILEE